MATPVNTITYAGIPCIMGRMSNNRGLRPSMGQVIITGTATSAKKKGGGGGKTFEKLDKSKGYDLIFTGAEKTVILKEIYVDRDEPRSATPDLVEKVGAASKIHTVFLKDRRWKFKWRDMIEELRANILGRDSAVLEETTLIGSVSASDLTSWEGEEASLENLIKMLFELLGEEDAKKGGTFVFSAVAGLETPQIKVKQVPPVSVLEKLIKRYGLVASLDLKTNTMEIHGQNIGLEPSDLIPDKFLKNKSVGAPSTEVPHKLIVYGRPTIRQVRVGGWEPVCMNEAGDILTLEEIATEWEEAGETGIKPLTASTSDGAISAKDFFREAAWAPVPFIHLISDARARLAKDWIYKAFRIPGFGDGVGGNALRLPMLKSLIAPSASTKEPDDEGAGGGFRANKRKPIARGYWAQRDQLVLPGVDFSFVTTFPKEHGEFDEDGLLVKVEEADFGKGATEPPWSYRFLHELGIVIFKHPMGWPSSVNSPLGAFGTHLALSYIEVEYAYEQHPDEDEFSLISCERITDAKQTDKKLIKAILASDLRYEKIEELEDEVVPGTTPSTGKAEEELVESTKDYVEERCEAIADGEDLKLGTIPVEEIEYWDPHHVFTNGIVSGWEIENAEGGDSPVLTKIRISGDLGFGSVTSNTKTTRRIETADQAQHSDDILVDLDGQARFGCGEFADEDPDTVRPSNSDHLEEATRVFNRNHFGVVILKDTSTPAATDEAPSPEEGEGEEHFCFAEVEETSEAPHRHKLKNFGKALNAHYLDKVEGSGSGAEITRGWLWPGYLNVKVIGTSSGTGADATYKVKESVGGVTEGPTFSGVGLGINTNLHRAVGGAYNELVALLKATSFTGDVKPAALTAAEIFELDIDDEAIMTLDKEGGLVLLTSNDMRWGV